jgi:hypothetical protein
MKPGISDLEIFPETHLERHGPSYNTDTSNEYHDESSNKKGPLTDFVMIVIILFIIVPAGVIFLYLLVHAIRECLTGCFY